MGFVFALLLGIFTVDLEQKFSSLKFLRQGNPDSATLELQYLVTQAAVSGAIPCLHFYFLTSECLTCSYYLRGMFAPLTFCSVPGI